MFKNRKLEIIKNKQEHLTYDVVFKTLKNKHTLIEIEKVEVEPNKFKYAIKVIKNIGTDNNFEIFDLEDKRFIAFDRALKIAENSLIDLMKEIRNIKRETKKENQ